MYYFSSRTTEYAQTIKYPIQKKNLCDTSSEYYSGMNISNRENSSSDWDTSLLSRLAVSLVIV
jgi:hypothetical protein